jgi:hypothetical protein
MVKRARSFIKDDKQVSEMPTRAVNDTFKEKAPRGETGPFLRREQLGEAHLVNACDAETFQARSRGAREKVLARRAEPGDGLRNFRIGLARP